MRCWCFLLGAPLGLISLSVSFALGLLLHVVTICVFCFVSPLGFNACAVHRLLLLCIRVVILDLVLQFCGARCVSVFSRRAF